MANVNVEEPKHKVNYFSHNQRNHMHPISAEQEREQTLFSAKPAYVEDDTDERFDVDDSHTLEKGVLISQPTDNNGIYVEESLVSSSSMEDSIKIYNVPKGEIVKTPIDNVDAEHGCNVDVDNNDNIIIQDKAAEILDEAGMAGEIHYVQPQKMLSKNMENGSDVKIIEETEVNLPKVKELAKKFVINENIEEINPPKSTPKRRKFSNDYELEVVNRSDPKLSGKHNHMHSLTARSLSREFREGLRLSMATPIKLPGGANEIPDGDVTRENSRPPSPVPQPGTLKNKLAFFESLKF